MTAAGQRIGSTLATTALALAAAGAVPAAPVRALQAPRPQPNVVVVLADDLDAALGTIGPSTTPNIFDRIAAAGATFERAYVTDSLCCPSRTTLLRGQYTHNHGVLTNGGATGGYERYGPLDLEASTLATWLRAAGYQTALVGKYINGYPLPADPLHVPPGWTAWVSPSDGNPYGSYNYTLNVDGRPERHGRAAEDHITDVLAGHADAFLERAARSDAPFFALVAPYAPHAPADPAPRHAALLPDLAAPRGGSYDEADVSDKPAAIAGRPPLRPAQQASGDALHRNRVLSMMAVDEMVGRLVATLEAGGQLADTVVLFTSDNGFHIGQHRLPQGKMTAYEEDIRVPFFVRGPGIAAGTVITDVLVGNVDLAPTVAELAGAATPDFVDGRSLAPWLRGTDGGGGGAGGDRASGEGWRQAFLVESYPFENERGVEATPAGGGEPLPPQPSARAGLLEPPDGDGAHGAFDPSAGVRGPAAPARPSFDALRRSLAAARPTRGRAAPAASRSRVQQAPAALYIAVRTDRHTYIEHATGEVELYDNAVDPAQLDNRAATADAWLLARLSTWARALHGCAGEGCRSLEAAWPIVDLPTATPTAGGPATATASRTPPTPAPTTPSPPATPSATTPAAAGGRLWLPVAVAWARLGADAPPATAATGTPAGPATATPPGRATATLSSPPPPATPSAVATAAPTPLSAAGCPRAAAYNAAADGVSLYVLRDGVPVCADYPNGGSADRAWGLASGTKSFSGVMAAAAIEDGLLSGWDERVADTIDAWRGDPRKSRITVRHLLSLTSGLDAGDVGTVPTYAEAIAAPAVAEPGARFEYGPVPYQVFGELMRRKLAGRYPDPLAYLDARILGPIGARYDAWRRGADGMPRLPSGAAFRAAEWATFGDLVRRHGLVDGQPLLRADLLAELFVGSDVRPTYGLTWWLLVDLDRPAPGAPARAVAAKGAGIQRLYVLDRYGIVAVRQTASQLDGPDDGVRFGDAAFLGRLLDDLGITP